MKKLLILLLMLLLVACGAAAPPDVETETGGVEQGAVSDTAGYNANEEAAATAVPPAESPVIEGDAKITPAITPAEAAQVRPQDWAIGADDPLVTIIEYGDFQ